MKKMLFLLLSGISFILSARDPALLFDASFDGYTVTADYAKGQPESTSFANPSLQLRMWEGVNGKGNALALEKTEQCIYNLKDNFDPRQGTISLWVAPLNWKPSEKYFQWFATAYQPGFTLHVYKYQWPNYLFFYIQFDKAPGANTSFTASTRIDDADWALNKWHKIDAVWDRNGMKLYVDGILPKAEQRPNSAPTHPAITFVQPLDFPAPGSWGQLKLNNEISQKDDKHHRTAFDNFRVYNRPLSAKEINDEYIKFIPSKFGSENATLIITVPAGKTIEPDGTASSQSWEDASRMPLNKPAPFTKNRNLPFEGNVAIKHDGKDLFIALSGNQPVAKATHTERDAALWEDDSYEIHLLSPDGRNRYQFIINANGALYDQKNGDAKWNSSLRSAVKRSASGWTAELAIPLAELGGKPGKGNFCYSNHANDLAAFTWNMPGGGGYADVTSFGSLLFRDTPIQITSLGNLKSGALDLALTAPDNAVPSAQYELENGVVQAYTGDLRKTPWRRALPLGRQKLSVSAKIGKETVYLYENYYYVNFPLELKYDCRPSARQISVSLDFNNAGADILNQLRSTGLSGKIALTNTATAQEVASAEFKAANPLCEILLPLPELPSGQYRITAKAGALETSQPFTVPDMTPYQAKAGVNHTVPPPWTPVKELSNLTFEVLDRTYSFDQGPFPTQIVSRGEKLFVNAPVLTLDGNPVSWSKAVVGARYPDYIELSGSGKSGDFLFGWKGELWFDGMYKIDWFADGKGKIDSLTLRYAIPEAFARYVFRQGYNEQLSQWENNRIEKTFNPLKHRDSTLQWMSGEVQGLAFAPVSNANWANKPNEPNIIITRDGKQADLTAKIISRPVDVTRKIAYTMIFQGTPSRRPDANWRDVNYGGYQVPTMKNLQFGGGGDHTFADYQTDQRWVSPSTHRPRWEARYRNWIATKPQETIPTKSPLPPRLINYVMPMHLGTNEPEYDYFIREWITQPNCVWSYKEDGMPQTIFACCGQTGITDLALYHLERLFQMNPAIGIYNDCAHSPACENLRHGCGGLDAFGQKYSTSTMLGQRDYFLREFKLIRQYDRQLTNHVPSGDFVPFVHNFSDLIWPGEEFYSGFGKNPDYFYCEGIAKEAYQSAFSPTIRGVGISLLPQPARAAGGIESIKHRRAAFETEPEWAIRTMTPVLLHGFNISPESIERKTVDRWWIIKDAIKLRDAEFLGYWQQNQVKSSSPELYVSMYKLPQDAPYRYLLVVGNLGRIAQVLKLSIDLPFSDAVDLWNNAPMTKIDLTTRELLGNHFALIGLK